MMKVDNSIFFGRVQKMFRHYSKRAKKQSITCFRFYDRDIPSFPLSIDFYDQKLYVCIYKHPYYTTDKQLEEFYPILYKILCESCAVNSDDIFIREREKMRDKNQYEKLNKNASIFTITENGLKFYINLSDYLDTWLFLDHRLTRAFVKEETNGKDFLNLFCYTGSFSVYAAAGNAKSTTSVDISKTYLDIAKKNMALNGFSGNNHEFIKEDVFQFLENSKSNSYDLIVLDPPTFSKSKAMKHILDIERDHPELILNCLRLLRNNGVLYFSNNSKKFRLRMELPEGVECKDYTKRSIPFDFQRKNLPHVCYRFKKS